MCTIEQIIAIKDIQRYACEIKFQRMVALYFKRTYSRGVVMLMAPMPTIGSRQYPSTEATRYASMPWSDIKFKRVYIEADPTRPTP
jgi:hypothetical protein